MGDRAESGVVNKHNKCVTNLLESLPDVTRSERINRGLSHRQAGAQMGVPYADLCRFEKGGKDPRLSTVLRITRWLEDRP